MERYLDKTLSPSERAADLLPRLSLEEKFAQTLCVWMDSEVGPLGLQISEETKQRCRNGMGAVSTLNMRTMTDHEQIAQAQITLQKHIMEQSEHHIPAIFHMEGLCGAFIQNAVSFPCGIARASSFDPELERKIGAIVARQERCFGITHTFAPVLDINRDARLGRQGETYGEDPTLAAALGTAYTAGVQHGQTEGLRSDAVAKHFLGFHNSEGGIHGAASNTPRRLMTEIYGKPFQAAITKAGLRGVMPCYCTFDGEAASVSKTLLAKQLRQEMGFNGLVVADYGAISNTHRFQRMFESYTEAGRRAMEAGMDMELPQQECFSDELREQLRTGEAPMEMLDSAVLRILEAKFRMGLFERPFALTGETLKQEFSRGEDRAVTLKSAEESLVLLKNTGVLPLRGSLRKIAIIGPHADNPRSFFGGYTHLSMAEATRAAANSLAGVGDQGGKKEHAVKLIPGTQIQSDETPAFEELRRQYIPSCKSLYQQLKAVFSQSEVVYSYGYPVAGNDESHFDAALRAMEGADLVILTLGGKHGSCSVASMGEGVDTADINLPACQDSFLRQAAQMKIPLVGIHFNGRAISSDTADEVLDAIIEAWSPAECGAEAIVNVLTGKVNPSGRLPVSVAYHAGQLPLYYNHPNGSSWHQGESIGFANYVDLPHTPRYYFGHGLSYTSFSYRDLTLSSQALSPKETVSIGLTVKNTGAYAGTEIVQLYVRDCYASMVRPCMELAGFRRVSMAPGEEQYIEFNLSASQLAFLDLDYRWKIEKGDIDLLLGASSADIRLRGQVRITEDAWISGSDRAFWA